MQETIAHLGNHVTAVETDTADGLCDPCRVAREKLVVSRCSKEADDTELHDEVVNNFLDLGLSHRAVLQFLFRVDIEEGGNTSERHRCAVLLFNNAEVAEVQPLNGLSEVSRSTRNIEAVALRHLRQFVQALDLLGDLFSLLDRFHVHNVRQDLVLRLSLLGDQERSTVKRDTAVVADDTSAAVSIRKTGQDTAVTCALHLRCVSVENAVVMGLSILEDTLDLRIHLSGVSFERRSDHADTAERHDRALQRSIGLQADDLFFVFVDISRGMGSNSRYGVLVDVKDAAVRLFLLAELQDLIPQIGGCLRRARQKRLVSIVRCVILVDKVADTDVLRPFSRYKHCNNPPSRSFLRSILNRTLSRIIHLKKPCIKTIFHSFLFRSKSTGPHASGATPT